MKNCKGLVKKNNGKLSTKAQDLFHLLESFGRLLNINDTASIWMLEYPIQKMNTYTCRPFQLFFFENLFIESENSEMLNHKNSQKYC